MFKTNPRLTVFASLASDAPQPFAATTLTADLWGWIAAAAMFALVSAVIFRSLRDAPFVEGSGRVIVSILVALLGVIGLFHGTGGNSGHSTARDPQSETKTTILNLLIPYAALALAIVGILIMFLLMPFVRVCRRGCASLHVWRHRFGQIKAKKHRDIRGGGACKRNRLLHGDRSGELTGSADNSD